MTRSFDGKVAVVTGAGSGMGKAAAQAFAQAGASVVVADVNAPAGEQVASELRQAGGEALFIKTDVSKAADVKAMVDGAVEAFGGLHCAFNNAGVGGHLGFIHEYPEEWFDLMVDVNLKGVFLCLKYEIAYMLEHGGGAIVNNSSSEGLRGAMPFAAYIGAKHGVVGLTKAAALETARHGIRVNAICPGGTRTPMLEGGVGNLDEFEEKNRERMVMGRLGLPEEMAGAVLWLCSDEASFVTGTTLSIDGGKTAG